MLTESFDMLHNDIPYGNDFKGYGKTKDTSHSVATRELRNIKNDDNLWWLPSVAHEFYRILKPDKFCVVWCQWRTDEIVRNIFRMAGFDIETIGVWDKGVQGLGAGFCETWEEWIVFKKGNAKTSVKMVKNIINEMRMNGVRPDHPHLKPKGVVKKIINATTQRGDLVGDFFAGTGVTAVSCLELDRRYFCSELEQEHVAKALTKINAYHTAQQFEFSQREGTVPL